MYLHYKYVNPIRNHEGKLRSWKEYNWLSSIENSADDSAYKRANLNEYEELKKKHIFLEKENEQRG